MKLHIAFVCLLVWCSVAWAQPVDPGALRLAIQDLAGTFPERYPEAARYLTRLAEVEKRLPDASAIAAMAQLQREALLASPLLCEQPIVFVTRRQYAPDHHNTATFFPAEKNEYNDGRFQGGGAIKSLDVRTGRVRTLLDLPQGIARDLEVSFDGKRILFSMRKSPADSYHIYEMDAEGTNLRQLTAAADVDDLDPVYLPDGSIVFSSTREPKYCACNRHIMANLYRMESDGANIHQIGKSTLFEGHTSLMEDGRLLYYRWEYVDRNFGDAQGLWTSNPDGTNHATVYGNNTPAPGAVFDARAIPGTGLVVCIFGSCHDRPWGAMAIIDPARGVDGRSPVARIWPADAIKRVKDPGKANNDWDAFMSLKLKYEDPYPLGEGGAEAGKYFLCSRMTGEGEQTGIYLLDTFGNEVLVHNEAPGSFDPMPLAARRRPPVIPARRDFESADGYFYVHNVYEGSHMAGVRRGEVKYLRVVESPEKRFWTRPGYNGQGFEGPAMNFHDFGVKRILGTVPVEADGSAYVAAPADTFVFFQLLDENQQLIQSMRSGTMVQSGERASCIGCHEDRLTAPPAKQVSMALKRAPQRLGGWLGQTRDFSFMRDVQPVFDRHCVSCHDYNQEAGKKLNLARGRGLAFNTAYTELWTRGQLGVPGAGPAQILQARSWGSTQSRLVKALQKDHYSVKLSPEELRRIITWVDLNAPYYPSFATAFPNNRFGRSPLDDRQLARLSQLTGNKLEHPAALDFDRPESSPCLAGLREKNPREYAEALAIVNVGRAALGRTPNPDDEAFIPCDVDRWREAKYAHRREIERLNRESMREGRKRFDDGISRRAPSLQTGSAHAP